MIPEQMHPTIRNLWPQLRQMCGAAGAGHQEAVLALTLAWLETGLESNFAQLERIASNVHGMLGTFALPRLVFAIWHAGTAAVMHAGERVPDNRDTQRFVRDGMACFHWLLANLDCILDGDRPLPMRLFQPAATVAHCRLIPPVPGASQDDNNSYALDRGIDIVVPVGSPVVAAASGVVVQCTSDTIWLALDEAFTYGRSVYPLACYRNLSRVDCWPRLHVSQGTLLGASGARAGGRVPYLHFGLVSDMHETDYLRPFQLAAVLGWL